MIRTELWLIYALVFGAVLLGMQGLYWGLFKERHEQKIINRRLALTAQLANPAEVLEALRKERGIEFLARSPSLRPFNDLMVQSGVRLSGQALLLAIGMLAVVAFLLLKFAAFGSDLLAVAFAVPVAMALLYLFLLRARRRRIAAFGEQLPDALDVIVRGLRAGHPFRVALGLVAREMPDPVGTEFGMIADEIMFGLEQSTAVDNLGDRVGLEDIAYFSTAVNIQSQTGGNLGEILTRLSTLLRSRAKLHLKVRALSSEGRLSAVALSLTPFILFTVITLLAPDYFVSIKDHWITLPATILGLLMLMVGNVLLYRMVHFKF
jgi:tight adherence protein B